MQFDIRQAWCANNTGERSGMGWVVRRVYKRFLYFLASILFSILDLGKARPFCKLDDGTHVDVGIIVSEHDMGDQVS